jgi:hypothetical protein
MRRRHAIAGMASAERFHRRDERIEIVQAADRRGDHLHQFALLFAQIGGKQFAQLWRDRKQALVEKIGRLH